ncbi:DUF397 domain-containing protein [Streptomyces sp. NBC_00291]|uniref:DUF397 domain-containing protein n=1 Tax=Streptomyces sp. NBC_00291 TaxID=2975704 RepID=UPI0022500821|nr:DUF397 domain-containing protein [Streptomyces sp. NBC_00291]MCX5153720.1 DUF397 domain-containing protein [Streptomyces sp. NBC_00291]
MIDALETERGWRKSSYSGNNGGECLEWAARHAATTGNVLVRDSKAVNGPVLRASGSAWASFVSFATSVDL